ncbi:MAG: transcription antiterminator [Tissierellia bacterium]|nr:transcription antiterminator [Tissierellia bacterium]
MTNREINIIRLFMSGDYLSLDAISIQLNISKRTVSRSISSIREKLEPLGFKLEFDHRLGYRLRYESEKDLFELKKLVRHNWSNSLESKILISLFENESLTIDEMGLKFYSSAYEIAVALKSVKKLLNKYDLDYSSKPYQGVYITGSELDIRNLIRTEYMIYYNNILVDILIPGYDEGCIDRIKNICRKVLVKNSMIIMDLDFSNLVSSILVSIYRRNNKTEKSVDDYSSIIKDIVLKINEELDLDMGLDEINYITSKAVLSVDGEQNIQSDRVYKVIAKAIEEISSSNPDYYIFNDTFYNALVLHVEYLMKRLKRKQTVENPLLNEIKQEYLVELNDAIKIGKNIKEEFNIAINEDELGFLAIHLGSAKKKLYSRKKAIIICNYGIGTSQIVQAKIEQIYKGIEIIGVYPSVYVEMAVAQKPDFIITTMELMNYSGDVPIIKAENILFDTEIKVDYKEDRFIEFFHENLYFETDYTSKNELIEKSIELITKYRKVCPDLLQKVMEREEISSTAIGQLVAIPHTICEGDFESFIAVVKNSKVVKWDDEDVRLVFFIVLNQKDVKRIEDLKGLYKRIVSVNLINDLLKICSYDEFIKQLRKGE